MASIFLKRARTSAEPLVFILIAIYAALFVLFEHLTMQLPFNELFDLRLLRDRMFSAMWLRLRNILKQKEEEGPIPALIASASGTIIEIGPGSGNQLSRYKSANVTRIFGIEPNAALHPALHESIKAAGLSDVYTIVPFGIEDLNVLTAMYGIKEGSIDTVVSCQVLCSVPDPEGMCKRLWKLLKPGGRFVVYEHVVAVDETSRTVQGVYDVVWPYLFGNCHMRRPTGDYVLQAGAWAEADVSKPENEDPTFVLPHFWGTLVKAQ